MWNELKTRFFNIYTLKAIASILVGMGLLQSEQVDQAINGSGGSTLMAEIGVAVYALCAVLRKDPKADA